MSDLHIDDFYRDTGKILAALFAQFPRRMTLFVEDISGPDTPDEFGLHSPRHEACLHTMLWLAQTGYLKYESLVRQDAIDQVVLTHMAFLALTEHCAPALTTLTADPEDPAVTATLPAPVRAAESLYIYRIRHELRHGTSFSLAEVIRSFMKSSRAVDDIKIY